MTCLMHVSDPARQSSVRHAFSGRCASAEADGAAAFFLAVRMGLISNVSDMVHSCTAFSKAACIVSRGTSERRKGRGIVRRISSRAALCAERGKVRRRQLVLMPHLVDVHPW